MGEKTDTIAEVCRNLSLLDIWKWALACMSNPLWKSFTRVPLEAHDWHSFDVSCDTQACDFMIQSQASVA